VFSLIRILARLAPVKRGHAGADLLTLVTHNPSNYQGAPDLAVITETR
jgi:hypothetical protein